MSTPAASQLPREPSLPGSRWTVPLAGAVLGLAVVAAYCNSFSDAFVYDDVPTIVDNPAVHQLWPLGAVRPSPEDNALPVAGRPLVQLSLALNYALGGTTVRGYHALNLFIHVLAALTLYGVVRRTLGLFDFQHSGATAFAAALLWAVHPLQTESVTYVVQRAESLMGLFFLLTLYCFIRSNDSPASGRWRALAVATCAVGMACKEVMVSAPLMVLLYDRAFVSGSFHEAWRRRAGFYAALAATWLGLAWLVAGAGSRGGTAGFTTPVAWWAYALTQFRAVTHYLWLAVWPQTLVFDHGVEVTTSATQVWPHALVVGALVGVTGFALWRRPFGAAPGRPALGFVGAWFFAILAPSSSIVPVATETMAEHRMYLPLAAVVVLMVVGVHAWLGRRGLLLIAFAAIALGLLTWRRNADYHSEFSLWRDTVAKSPANARAHYNLGLQLFQAGNFAAAVREYQAALRLKPNLPSAHANLANALFQLGDLDEARAHCEIALRLNPALAEAHANLGNVHFRKNQFAEALREYERAVRLKPDDADLHNNLGTAFAQLGRLSEAAAQYTTSLRLRPASAETHFFLGNTLARLNRFAEAIAQYERALQLQPDHVRARENLDRVRAIAPSARTMLETTNRTD
jgi:protein O-mannosyl-transferase